MGNHWEALQAATDHSLDVLWEDFAKQGKETAALAPLEGYPNAAAWLARYFAESSHYLTRKLGAMIAGWIQDQSQTVIPSEMLDKERRIFCEDSLSANSVADDILFSATRWTESKNRQVAEAGTDVLARMINDALEGTAWNTANWAVGNLYRATDGKHAILQRLHSVEAVQVEGQKFFWNAIEPLKRHDQPRLAARPSAREPLAPDNPHFALISALWKAAEEAEAAG
jgi:hypothetical protein